MTRNEAISIIKKALKRRSGKTWSVTGGRGTAYGWITIDAPPSRRTWVGRGADEHDTGNRNGLGLGDGHMGPDDRQQLAALLDLKQVHYQGREIPAASDYRQEYIDRAEGRTPSVLGTPYWD